MVDSKKDTNKAERNALPTSTTIKPRVQRFMDAWVHDSSPLDINLDNVTSITLPPLIWLESETIPLKMSVRNIGMTFNVDAEYSGSRPSLNGSILQCPYEFSSFHFHWGTKLSNGSEHRTMGKCSPMEIHLVFYNISYSDTSKAFNAEDGKLILTYMCKLDHYENNTLDNMTSNLTKIKKPGEVVKIDSFALSSLFDNDLQNYLMYWSVCEVIRENTVLWMISPKEISINKTQLTRMRSLRGPNDQRILSNCRLAKLSGGNKVLRVTQHSVDQKKNQSMEEKDNIALAAPEQKDIPDNMVKSGTSAQTMEKAPEQKDIPENIVKTDTPEQTMEKAPKQKDIPENIIKSGTSAQTMEKAPEQKDIPENMVKTDTPEQTMEKALEQKDIPENIIKSGTSAQTMEKAPEQKDIPENIVKSDTSEQKIEKEPEQLLNNSKIDSGDVVKKETVIISVVTTAPIVKPIVKNNDCSKKYIQSSKSLDLEDQRKDVEHILYLAKPLYTKHKEKNILNDVEMTKDMVISSIDSLMLDLTNDDKVELKTFQRPEVRKTHRDGVRMNATALRREMHIKNKDITSHELEDRCEEMESVSEHFESALNLMKPLDVNDKDKNVPNVEQIKDISCIDKIIIPVSMNDNKVDLKTSQRLSVLKNHREGVRMNATALRREMHIKNRQQKIIENMKKK